MNKVYILLGGNVGDVNTNFGSVETYLLENSIVINRKSSVYITKAWGNENQPDFKNRVLEIETRLKPIDLLNCLLEIEKKIGRIRTKGEKWTERPIDIDILFYNNAIINMEPTLLVPHPFIAQRRFTLVPLTELIPDFIHPVLKKSIQRLLKECEDTLEVKKQFLS